VCGWVGGCGGGGGGSRGGGAKGRGVCVRLWWPSRSPDLHSVGICALCARCVCARALCVCGHVWALCVHVRGVVAVLHQDLAQQRDAPHAHGGLRSTDHAHPRTPHTETHEPIKHIHARHTRKRMRACAIGARPVGSRTGWTGWWHREPTHARTHLRVSDAVHALLDGQAGQPVGLGPLHVADLGPPLVHRLLLWVGVRVGVRLGVMCA
jgi:hypothetical protein